MESTEKLYPAEDYNLSILTKEELVALIELSAMETLAAACKLVEIRTSIMIIRDTRERLKQLTKERKIKPEETLKTLEGKILQEAAAEHLGKLLAMVDNDIPVYGGEAIQAVGFCLLTTQGSPITNSGMARRMVKNRSILRARYLDQNAKFSDDNRHNNGRLSKEEFKKQISSINNLLDDLGYRKEQISSFEWEHENSGINIPPDPRETKNDDPGLH